ncbi:pentatricopeptide repeat (PPR) superfamily protein [Tasmannia lanceolata]|uniref:pentatricopeptide repeat (PPR) superfamily protein n=1 Tax=Tasmannia lanceolata TaxID=3420 RepID=UPI004063D459
MLPHLSQALIRRTRPRNPNFLLSLRPKNPNFLFSLRPFSANSSWLSSPGNPLLRWPQNPTKPPSPPPPKNPPPKTSKHHLALVQKEDLQNHQIKQDFNTLCNLLKDPSLSDNSSLQSALNLTKILPNPHLIETLIHNFDSSPKPSLLTLILWAHSHPTFHPTPLPLFNSIIHLFSKSKQFHSAWSLLIDRLNDPREIPPLVSLDTFAILIRRYARAGNPQSAIRTFEFIENLVSIEKNPSRSDCDSGSNSDPFNVLIDALCKEGHVNSASWYLQLRSESKPDWIPSVQAYNILLNGWFRSRKLRKAERLWEEMRRDHVTPTVVSYGTAIEGYCRMRRVEKAIELLEEMKRVGIELNVIVYNPIIDALAEAGQFKEALGMLERMSVYGLSPTISTYNSLVKGFCKAGDLVGASKILKMMIGRGCLPTATTYNYFFRFFAKFGKIEEGMNLYAKMIESGYEPDRLTYHLLIKMLCECERLDLAVQVVKEMNAKGCDSDLATSTMLVHLLCRMRRLEDACFEFEGMINRGVVPQYLTYKRLLEELRKSGMLEMARKLSCLMDAIPHSTKLPNTFSDRPPELRSSIMRKAEVMSDILKTCRNPRELIKQRGSSGNAVASANRLIEDIQRRAHAT